MTGFALSFWQFFKLFVLAQRLQLPLKGFHFRVCNVLQRAVLGQISKRFIIINIAPRVGKSKILQALCLWMIAYYPDAQIILTSYGGNLAEESLSYIKKVLISEWFQSLFPGTNLGMTRKADHISTSREGNLYAEGVCGELTGKGAGLKRPCGGFIGIDDPIKPDEVFSATESAKINRWLETTLKSRRNSDVHTPIIVIMQRLDGDDLCGYLEKTYPDECEIIRESIIGPDGESLAPETISTKTIKDLEKTRMGRFVLASQYKQQPIALGGNLIPVDKFLRFNPAEAPKFEQIIITVDTGLRAKEHNDNSVLQCWGRLKGHAYLLDEAIGKWESPELLENSLQFYRKHNQPERPIRRFTIEAKAAGIGLAQQMRRLGIPVEEIERSKDKVTRVQEVLPYIETGMVHIPQDGLTTWLPEFLTELASFKADGTSAHDDQVDAMADGIWLTLGRALSIFDVLGGTK
jgi:predicted phage terminase large subunit-like protein